MIQEVARTGMGLIQSIKHLTGIGQQPEPVQPPGAERRRHRRIQSSRLTIFIDGKRYKTNDWSLGGFRVVVPGNKFATGVRISGALHGPGLFDRGVYEATISWVSDTGEIGAHFIEVSHESFLAMSAAQI